MWVADAVTPESLTRDAKEKWIYRDAHRRNVVDVQQRVRFPVHISLVDDVIRKIRFLRRVVGGKDSVEVFADGHQMFVVAQVRVELFRRPCAQAALTLATRAPLREDLIAKPDGLRRNLRENSEVRHYLSPLVSILFSNNVCSKVRSHGTQNYILAQPKPEHGNAAGRVRPRGPDAFDVADGGG